MRSIGDLATELLSDLGIEVTIAVNGKEAVDCLSPGRFDLVLMDLQMPVMDGLTATRLICADERFRGLPILAMTAHRDERGPRKKQSKQGWSTTSPSRLIPIG